jgi:hypothetical protein
MAAAPVFDFANKRRGKISLDASLMPNQINFGRLKEVKNRIGYLPVLNFRVNAPDPVR